LRPRCYAQLMQSHPEQARIGDVPVDSRFRFKQEMNQFAMQTGEVCVVVAQNLDKSLTEFGPIYSDGRRGATQVVNSTTSVYYPI